MSCVIGPVTRVLTLEKKGLCKTDGFESSAVCCATVHYVYPNICVDFPNDLLDRLLP